MFTRLARFLLKASIPGWGKDDREIQEKEAEMYELTIPDFSPMLHVRSGMAGHLLFLFHLTREIRAKEVIEIGLGGANSAIAFLLALKETGGRLTSIEPMPREDAIARIGDADLEGCWNLVRGASQDVRHEFSDFPGIDLLFIDGKHSYIQCKQDYELYGNLVREGGYILFHDSNTIAGVKKFVGELRKAGVEGIHFPFCNGVFVARKRGSQ